MHRWYHVWQTRMYQYSPSCVSCTTIASRRLQLGQAKRTNFFIHADGQNKIIPYSYKKTPAARGTISATLFHAQVSPSTMVYSLHLPAQLTSLPNTKCFTCIISDIRKRLDANNIRDLSPPRGHPPSSVLTPVPQQRIILHLDHAVPIQARTHIKLKKKKRNEKNNKKVGNIQSIHGKRHRVNRDKDGGEVVNTKRCCGGHPLPKWCIGSLIMSFKFDVLNMRILFAPNASIARSVQVVSAER